MSTENSKGNVDAQIEESTEVKAPDLADFASPAPDPKQKQKEKSEVEAEETEEVEEIEEQEETETEDTERSEETEETEEEGEVLSQELDIEKIAVEDRKRYLDDLYASLEDDDRREWLSNQDGRIGKDVGKLRKEKAEAQKEAEAAEAKYLELQSKTYHADNPFSTVFDEKELDDQAKRTDANIKAAREFLRSNEDYIEVNGKEIDRATVDTWLDGYLAEKEALPKQRERIKQLAKAKEAAKETETKLADTYKWLNDEGSETFKAYQKLRTDPKWSMVADLIPELSAELPKVLAKYVDSGTKTQDGTTAKRKLPIRGDRKARGDLSSGGGGSQRRNASGSKKASEKLFQGSANERDVLAMFT